MTFACYELYVVDSESTFLNTVGPHYNEPSLKRIPRNSAI